MTNFGYIYILCSQLAQGQGGWGGNGGSASSWSSSSSQSGQPGSNGNHQFSYSYGGIDANGVPYGGATGNATYNVQVTDEHGRTHTYSGGQGNFGGPPPTSNSQSFNNQNRGQQHSSSSSSAYASAWSTFYIICLFSLFLLIKS